MDYEKVYTADYFSGKNSFFYKVTGGYRDVKRYFDNLADAYRPHFAGGPLLDIGCAYGFLLERFQGRAELYGHDISAHAIELARARLPAASFSLGSAADPLPFADRSFAGVMMTDVIEHLTRADQSRALDEAARVLRPGGTLYITTPNHNWVRRIFYAVPDRMEHHIGMLHVRDLVAAVAARGLRIVDAWSYLHGLIPVRLPSWLGPEAAVIAQRPV